MNRFLALALLCVLLSPSSASAARKGGRMPEGPSRPGSRLEGDPAEPVGGPFLEPAPTDRIRGEGLERQDPDRITPFMEPAAEGEGGKNDTFALGKRLEGAADDDKTVKAIADRVDAGETAVDASAPETLPRAFAKILELIKDKGRAKTK